MFYSIEATHPSELSYCSIRNAPARMEQVPEEEPEYSWADAFVWAYGAVIYGAGCVLAGMLIGWMVMGGV